MPKMIETEDDKEINETIQLQKTNKQPDEKVIENNQESAPGLYIQTGEIQHGDYDTKNWQDLIKDYTEMRNGDPVIRTTTNILQFPILKSERIITPGKEGDPLSEEAAEYVDWTYDNLHKGFPYLLRHKLLAIFYGVSIHEVIIKRADRFKGKLTNRIVKMAPIMPETIEMWNYNKVTFDLESITQDKRIPDGGIIQQEIPVEKLDIFTYNEEYDDVQGNSLLRPLRTSWTSKTKVLIGKVINTQRGAGIPTISYEGVPSSADKKKISQIARSMSLGPQSYVSFDRTKLQVDLLEPKNQGDVMPLLDYLDRQIFFNSLTEFLSSGIGSNGSRAATSEHKSAYELAATYILQVIEDDFQRLTDRIIDDSPYAKMDPELRPVFKFAAITQADSSKVASDIEKLLKSGAITLQPGDEDFIRDQFNWPVSKLNTKVGPVIEENIDNEQDNESQLTGCNCQGSIQLNNRPWDQAEFRLEKANEELQNIQSTSESEIDVLMNKILLDIYSQIKDNTAIDFKLRFQREFDQRMKKQFDKAFDMGQVDVSEEFNKLSKKGQAVKLALSPTQKTDKNKRIERAVNKLYFDLKNVIEDKLEIVNDAVVKRAGGLKSWILGFSDKFKGSKRKILTEVDGGYFAGRSDTNKAISKDVENWFYSARLDNNLCEACAPLDGAILTNQELLNNTSLSRTGENVNLDCLGLLGPNKCRCVLIPFNSENL